LLARTYFNSKNKPVASETTIKQPQAISKILSPLLVISTPLRLVGRLFWGAIEAINSSCPVINYIKLINKFNYYHLAINLQVKFFYVINVYKITIFLIDSGQAERIDPALKSGLINLDKKLSGILKCKL